MRILIVASALFFSNSLTAAPRLDGTYHSPCRWEGLGENPVNANRTTLVFSGRQFTSTTRFYKDSRCQQSGGVRDEAFSATFTIGQEVQGISYPRGKSYKLTFQYDNGESWATCFYPDSKAFSDQEGLYLGGEWKENEHVPCQIDAGALFGKVP